VKLVLPITQGFTCNLLRSEAFKNVRGKSRRHPDKAVRCGTHMDVLRSWVARLKPQSILEHGAGLNSTPYLRSLGIRVVTIEDDPRWHAGAALSVPFEHWDASERFDIVLVDGPGTQRAQVVEASMIVGSRCIIEHDAEAWSSAELELRLKLCDAYGYAFSQDSTLNPETAVMLAQSSLR
jgi:hypothetical protein